MKIKMVSQPDGLSGPSMTTWVLSFDTARDMSVVSGLNVTTRIAATIGRRIRNIGKA